MGAMKKRCSLAALRVRAWLRNPWPFAALVGCALLYVGALVSGLAEDVLEREEIVVADGRLVYWLAAQRTAAGIALAKAVSVAGNWETVVILLPLLGLLLWRKHLRAFATILLACIGSEAVVYFGKLALNRPRPPAVLSAVHELDASFPSGHANISVAFYALGFYLLGRSAHSRGLRCLWYILAVAVPLLIGSSRLYLGVHYLSDVLAGWCVGLWWSLLALGIAGFLRRRSALRSREH